MGIFYVADEHLRKIVIVPLGQADLIGQLCGL